MRPTIYRPSLSIALAAMLSACSATDTVSVSAEPRVSLIVGEGTNGQDILPLVPQLRVSQGTIDVLGHFRTSTPCWALDSRVERSGSVITLYVTAREATASVCTQVISVRPYEAHIAPLAAGKYTMRVVHEYFGGTQKSEELLRSEVSVP